MKSSKFSILLVIGLLGLLGLLATLQYRWLGQISDGERERMQKRLETDSQRFAEDFNREIRNAYFTFQIDANAWNDKNFAEFNERLKYWKSNTAFPKLIKDFYFVKDGELLRYDVNSQKLVSAEWTDELKNLSQTFGQDKKFEAVNEKLYTLSLPIYENAERFFIRKDRLPQQLEVSSTSLPPKAFGYLVIKLDEDVIKNQILPAFYRQYFSEGEDSAYNLAVISKADEANVIFATEKNIGNTQTSHDISIPILNLTPGNFAVFLNQDFLTKISNGKNILLEQRIENTGSSHPEEGKMITIESRNGEQKVTQKTLPNLSTPSPPLSPTEKTRVMQGITPYKDGYWTLIVNHRDGSLENFIGSTRRKNLAVSFGILGLLGTSILLIFLSARRAQTLAQRQMDFVSAVSHEFRTPISVIHSAGENLTDGIVNSKEKIERYGNLIKGEGKKLSQMVEQILEFAGARSGQKKYDFREIDVKTVIENALAECQPLLAEKDFTVEKEIMENLPKINADSNALSHAVQNLIINAVKYGHGHQYLKIAAKNGDGQIKITVEDKGIGIAKKDISKIFTPFYRAKSVVDAQIHGNGLGLSLVKQTVEAHHGKVNVESEIGKGSKFVIHLPVII